MELHVNIDEAVALTLRPMRQGWPEGDSMVVHNAATRLSCGIEPSTPRRRIQAWLEHLVPENGHRTEFQSRASRRMERLGYGETVANVGQTLWGNADAEYAGKIALRAYDAKERQVHVDARNEYASLDSDEVGILVAAAGRIAEQGRMAPQAKTVLRAHGLSGSRGKICLRWSWAKQHWMIPKGSTLSSHILKEESSRAWLPAEAAIESYCQRALALAGITAAPTRARLYNTIATVVSTRTDRIDAMNGRPLERTHQEEWSQAIGIHPYQKNDERPDTDWRTLFRLLGTHGLRPEEEQQALAKAITGLTLIGCADTHRRNVGVQHVWGQEGQKIVLAPLYDCSSIEGTEWAHDKRAVIPIGGEANFDEIRGHHWRRLAEAGGVDTSLVLNAVREIAERLPDALRDATRESNEHDHAQTPKARNTRIEAISLHTAERCRRTIDELGTLEAATQARSVIRTPRRPPWPTTPGPGFNL